MQGWISIHRQVKDHWLYQEKRVFSKYEAWLDLLMLVNHSDAKIVFGNELVEIKRGSTITSIRKLCDSWQWSNTKVKNFLELLQKDKMIVYKSDTKKTVLSIENYSLYQKKPEEERHENDAETYQKLHNNISKAYQKHTNNNDNNVEECLNNENNENNSIDVAVDEPKKKKKPKQKNNDDVAVDEPKKKKKPKQKNNDDVAVEIYDYYKNTLKGGTRQQSINNIMKWLKDYTKDQLITSIDNYYNKVKKDETKQYWKQPQNFFGVKDESKGYFIDYLYSETRTEEKKSKKDLTPKEKLEILRQMDEEEEIY